MKNLIGRKSKTPPKPVSRRYRMTGRMMWVVIIVWIVLFLLIRASFKIGGNPAIIFLIMFGLFFAVLFALRVSLIRFQGWWPKFRTRLVHFLAAFFSKR